MYWWELVVLLRKYFIITASTFVVSDTNQLQMTFGIVLVALLLHITNHPFERDTQEGVTLHLYEMMSLLVLSVVIWCGQYFTNSPGLCETTMKGTCFFMVISIILINFVYMLFLLIKCGSHWWKRRRISKKLGRLKKIVHSKLPFSPRSKTPSTFKSGLSIADDGGESKLQGAGGRLKASKKYARKFTFSASLRSKMPFTPKKSGFKANRGGEKYTQGAAGGCNIEMVVSTSGSDVSVDTDMVNPIAKRQKSVHRAMEQSARDARRHRRARTEGSLAIGFSAPNVRRQTTQMPRRRPPDLACEKINENMGTDQRIAQVIAHHSSDPGSAVGEQKKTRQEEDAPRTLVRETSSETSSLAKYDYEPSELDEISLQEGDVVEAVVDTGDGWAKGTNARTGKTGTFPLSYIE